MTFTKYNNYSAYIERLHLLVELPPGALDGLVGAGQVGQGLVGVADLLLDVPPGAVRLLQQGPCLLQRILKHGQFFGRRQKMFFLVNRTTNFLLYWTCNFPMNPPVRLLVGLSVSWSVSHNFYLEAIERLKQ